jgi:ATP-dependent DNA helicase RecQ
VAKPHEILQSYWGYDQFRPLQEDIIGSILAGKDTLALLPTGGGKSLCFQVPGLVLPGLTLVISPLIALMRDQVEQLNRRHIPATYINSSLSRSEIDRKLQMAMDGKYKFLYLAPERIETEMFLARLGRMQVSLVAIDEAHCISQWGYDFRPSYLRIAVLRTHLPKVPFAAFTATAPPLVRADILQKLELQQPAVFTQSFRRSNLSYRVIAADNVAERILRFTQNIQGAGVIYARTRKRVQSIADYLKREGISAAAYHGGLPAAERDRVQTEWINNGLRVIAATNAFGMGIDKPDVRFVLHYNMPGDLESYYQEAGRAGRDGQPCLAACFHNAADLEELRKWVKEKYPTWEQLCVHYDVLCNHFGIAIGAAPDQDFPLDITAIAKTFQVHPIHFHNSLRLLDTEGILSLNERAEDFAYLMVTVQPHYLLDYKQRYPAKAELIDHILRSLGGGVYSDSVSFRLKPWTLALGLDEAALKQQLDQLAVRGVIAWHAPTTSPTIRFTRARLRLTREELQWDKYIFLNKQALERLAQVEEYLDVPGTGCRSRFLETYFGEVAEKDCGVCDVCRAAAVGPLDQQLIAAIRADVFERIGAGDQDIPALIERLHSGTRPQRLEVIRMLLDAGQLLRAGTQTIRKP